MSKERGSELSRRPQKSRSNSKQKATGPTSALPTDPKSKIDTTFMEITAKGFKSKKGKKLKKKKEVVLCNYQNLDNSRFFQETSASKSPSTLTLGKAESHMDFSGNVKNVEKGVKVWIELLEKMDFRKTMEPEFKPIDTMKADLEKCQAFKKNIDFSQSENVELYDTNRVKGGGEADFFYHGSTLTIPSVRIQHINFRNESATPSVS